MQYNDLSLLMATCLIITYHSSYTEISHLFLSRFNSIAEKTLNSFSKPLITSLNQLVAYASPDYIFMKVNEFLFSEEKENPRKSPSKEKTN